MYLRAIHADADVRTLRDIIRKHPLGIFTTATPSASKSYPLIQCTHIPFLLDLQDETSETELGVLRGHMARANPHSKALIEAAAESPDGVIETEVMVLFNVPAHHYVTPKFYVETKPKDGKVVPTWNYAAAQVYGKAKIFYDSKSDETSEFLQKAISDLTDHAEETIMGHTGKANGCPEAWRVSDAPENYVGLLKKAIIGVEIHIERLEGKFKMSQESTEGDRQGVIAGFEKMGGDNAQEVANIVKERAALKKARAEAKAEAAT